MVVNRVISAARAMWYAMNEERAVESARADNSIADDPREPLISVLIPTFNRAELLFARALPSVLRQTYKNFEVIVAAHGCTDHTHVKVFVTGQSDHRVRLLRVPRTRTYPPIAENHWLAGPVAPLNAALADVRGQWIARIDDDDEWTPDHLENLLTFARRGNYEFVSSAYTRTQNSDTEVVEHDGCSPPIGGVQTWLYRSYLKFMRYNPDCWRKKWNRVNDTDLADRFRKAGVRIGWMPDVTARILPRPGETKIGSQAYIGNAAEVERKFAFD